MENYTTETSAATNLKSISWNFRFSPRNYFADLCPVEDRPSSGGG